MINNIDYNRILELSEKIKTKTATLSEKDEYMLFLLNNGSISKSQYQNYLDNKSNDEIIDTALTIGGIILFAYIISKILK